MTRIGRVLTLLLIVMLLISSASFAAEKEGTAYTALGDSIAFGTGGTDDIGYTERLNAHFEKIFGVGAFWDLSANGVTSGMLEAALTDPGNSNFAAVNAAVFNSDHITISIGGNDVLQPVIDFVEAYPAYLTPGYFDMAIADPANHVELAGLMAELNTAAMQFPDNWGGIIEHITGMNGTAEIYVTTQYNPFANDPMLYEFADYYISIINMAIINGAEIYGYKVADVYTAFNEYGNQNKPVIHESFADPAALHPTDVGYKFIYNLHKDLME